MAEVLTYRGETLPAWRDVRPAPPGQARPRPRRPAGCASDHDGDHRTTPAAGRGSTDFEGIDDARPGHRRRRLCGQRLGGAAGRAGPRGDRARHPGHRATGAVSSRAPRSSTAASGDQDLLARTLRDRGIEAVLHCAARSLVGQSMADPALYYHENVVGGIALLDALREAGVDRIVFSSTAAVYGEPERVPIAEIGPDPTRQPVRRVQARVRGRHALVRRVRPALGGAALLQRRGRQRPQRRGARSRDAPHPEPAAGRRRAARR